MMQQSGGSCLVISEEFLEHSSSGCTSFSCSMVTSGGHVPPLPSSFLSSFVVFVCVYESGDVSKGSTVMVALEVWGNCPMLAHNWPVIAVCCCHTLDRQLSLMLDAIYNHYISVHVKCTHTHTHTSCQECMCVLLTVLFEEVYFSAC